MIVTARDAALYLNECLDSIATSRYRDLQVIVVDDGSSDETGEIATTWAAKDSRFEALRLPPSGRRAALQVGHDRAHGAVQCWVDADDIVHPTAIEECLKKIDNKHQLVYTHRDLIDHTGASRGPHQKNRIAYRRNQLLVDNMIFHLRLFTTELFDRSGGVGDLESAIDWDMNLRMTEHTTPRCVPRILYSYRIHPDRMSRRPEQHTNGRIAVQRAIERRNLDVELVVNANGWHLRRTRSAPPETGLSLP